MILLPSLVELSMFSLSSSIKSCNESARLNCSQNILSFLYFLIFISFCLFFCNAPKLQKLRSASAITWFIWLLLLDLFLHTKAFTDQAYSCFNRKHLIGVEGTGTDNWITVTSTAKVVDHFILFLSWQSIKAIPHNF